MEMFGKILVVVCIIGLLCPWVEMVKADEEAGPFEMGPERKKAFYARSEARTKESIAIATGIVVTICLLVGFFG